MPYPQNFIVRLLVCIVGMFALWMAAHYIGTVLIRQEAFTIGPIDIILPLGVGVYEAYAWKPKQK